uniref:Mitochondrial import inner membrane translocase subunit TIM50 n=1 Tax=Ditylenchus dipsaci TaxID=166011 RepID=A0A915EML6_9BILA
MYMAIKGTILKSSNCRWYTFLRNASSSDQAMKNWKSVVGEPKIRSPFDNPPRFSAPEPSEYRSSIPSSSSNQSWEGVSYQNTSQIKDRTSASARNEFKTTESEVSPAASSNGNLWYRMTSFMRIPGIEDMSEQDKKAKKLARNTKLGCYVVFGSLALGIVWFIWEYSGPQRDNSGSLVTDQYTGSWLAYLYRCRDAAYAYVNTIVEPSRDVLLPPPLPIPYHQPKYTVVVEMKNVLYHPEWTYSTGHRFKKRPALDYFLDVVGYPNFELVVYTSEAGPTAEPLVKSLDPKQKIMYHLYRDCTKYMSGNYVKDLNKLGRDLKKVIYIDFDPNAFQLNPENVLRIPKWEGNMDDTTLVDLAELLKTIFMSEVDDVRPTLQHYSQFDNPAAEFKRRALMVAEQQKQADEAKETEKPNMLKRALGKTFGFQRHSGI